MRSDSTLAASSPLLNGPSAGSVLRNTPSDGSNIHGAWPRRVERDRLAAQVA